MVSAAAPAGAAPANYETAVQANNPYVYYRQGETGGTVAEDTSVNNRDGFYNGTPTFAQSGLGLGSDNAVAYDGTDNEVLSANINTFGSSIGTSSFEFVFKVNPGFSTTTIQSLFGAFTAGGNLPDVNVDLNSRGNDALGALANTTRLFVRGNNADANGGASVAGHFTNAALYDGNYHHLVFTFDAATVDPDTDGAGADTGGGGFRAYVDGVEQAVSFTQVNGTIAPAGFGDLDVPATWAARNVRVNPITSAGVTREANITLDETALYGTVLTPEQVQTHAVAAGVPEPTSIALIAGAAAATLFRRRRHA